MQKKKATEAAAQVAAPSRSAQAATPSRIEVSQPKTELKLQKQMQMPAVSRKPPGATPAARVDIPPDTGYSVVVDGHFKGHHSAESAALADAKALKARYPFLRIEIFDAAKKARSSVG